MLRTAKITISALIILLASVTSAAAAPTPDRVALLKMINAKRAEAGAPLLKFGTRVERAAQGHSADMAAKGYMAHRSPTGSTLTKRLKSRGIIRWNRATQNITSAGNETRAFNKWQGSSGSRRKMLDPRYTHVGIGVAKGGKNGKVYTLTLVANPETKPKTKPAVPAPAGLIMSSVNAQRAKVGAPPLKWELKLANVGRLHSVDMIQNDYFSHTSNDGRSLVDRLRDGSVTGWNRAGENLAGTNSAERAFELWMNSPSHRDNMLDPKYTNIGVGIATDGSFSIFTMNLVAYPQD